MIELTTDIPDKFPFPRTKEYSTQFFDEFSKGFAYREQCIKKGMFAFVSWEWVTPLSQWIKNQKCLEVMAGRGWLTKALREKGIDIIGTDDYSWYTRKSIYSNWEPPITEIEKLDSIDAVEKYGKDIDVLIMSWPPYEKNIAAKTIKALHKVNKKAQIIYIGEGYGGCCADDDFFHHFKEIEDDEIFNKAAKEFRCWHGLHDYLTLGKYKSPK